MNFNSIKINENEIFDNGWGFYVDIENPHIPISKYNFVNGKYHRNYYNCYDKIEEELKEKEEIKEKKKDDDKKQLFKYFKNNKKVVECLYEKMEKGEIYKEISKCNESHEENNILTLHNIKNKIGDVIKLGGGDDNVKLQIDDINEEKRSKRSDSSNSLMDFDVVCNDNNEEKK